MKRFISSFSLSFFLMIGSSGLFAQKFNLVSLQTEFESSLDGTFFVEKEGIKFAEIGIKGINDRFLIQVTNLTTEDLYFDLQHSQITFDEVHLDFASLVKEHSLQPSPDLMATIGNGISGIFHHIGPDESYQFMLSTWAFPQIHGYLALQAEALHQSDPLKLKENSILEIEWVFFQEDFLRFPTKVWVSDYKKKQKIDTKNWFSDGLEKEEGKANYHYAYKKGIPLITVFAALPLLWLLSIGADI